MMLRPSLQKDQAVEDFFLEQVFGLSGIHAPVSGCYLGGQAKEDQFSKGGGSDQNNAVGGTQLSTRRIFHSFDQITVALFKNRQTVIKTEGRSLTKTCLISFPEQLL